MADWFDTIVTNRGFDLVVGAILATIGGYVATLIQESRHRKAVRQGLGTILHAELISETPTEDPIYRNPDKAMRISLRSVPHLLAPGILDPSRHQHLMMDLIFLASVVDQFNERAMLWDQAFASGADDAKLQSLYNSLQSSNWDYRDIHANVLVQLWQLGPPMPLSDTYEQPGLRDKFERWRTRKVRQAWIDYQNREKTQRNELAQIFATPPAVEQGDPASPDSV